MLLSFATFPFSPLFCDVRHNNSHIYSYSFVIDSKFRTWELFGASEDLSNCQSKVTYLEVRRSQLRSVKHSDYSNLDPFEVIKTPKSKRMNSQFFQGFYASLSDAPDRT